MLLDKSTSLREFTILKESPMPSYRDKLDAQELADLVTYLRTLRGRLMTRTRRIDRHRVLAGSVSQRAGVVRTDLRCASWTAPTPATCSRSGTAR